MSRQILAPQDSGLPPVLFLHANGFPARVYRQFLGQLDSPGGIHAIDRLALHTPVSRNWESITDEVVSEAKALSLPPIAIGHSVGGYTAMAALTRHPELFSGLIMLEPPILVREKRMVLGLLRLVGLVENFGPAALARRRRDRFDSADQAFQYFRPKSLFRDFSDEGLRDYVEFGLSPNANPSASPDGSPNSKGLELSISKEVEHAIFKQAPWRIPRLNNQVPAWYLRGSHSNVVSARSGRQIARALPKVEYLEAQGGHLFPLEHPETSAKLVNSLIQRCLDRF